MNKHLQLVRNFRKNFSLPEALPGSSGQLSDMTIVLRQAWLMEAGKQVLLAIKQGDMGVILARLTGLAYLALNAIAIQRGDVEIQPVNWRHDGSVLSLVRLISDRINACSSGQSRDYSALYCACAQLIGGFLNADFDKAFNEFHQYELKTGIGPGLDAENRSEVDWNKTPDLSDCLYE